MMKKFVMLMLVLGIASIANAGYSLVVSDGSGNITDSSGTYAMAVGNVWLGVVNDTAGTTQAPQHGDNFVVVALADASFTGSSAVYQPPSVPGWITSSFSTAGLDVWHFVNTEASTFPVAAGVVLAEFQLSVTDLSSDVVVDLWDSASAFVDSVTLTLIPEPMTMVLLGLGGLFLRRRK